MRSLKRWLAIVTVAWFLFCLIMASSLIFSDHWSCYALGLTPIPSVLVPMSFLGVLLLGAFHVRALPWGLAALLASFILTPFGAPGWSALNGTMTKVETERAELTILTANAGKRDRDQLLGFAENMQVDLLAIQAARLPADASLLADMHYAYVERLSLWSRWPILTAEPIRVEEQLIAARFEIAWPLEQLVVYVMHLPSPRHVLGELASRKFLSRETRQKINDFQHDKWRHLAALSERIRGEAGPVLLVGDANQPPFGPAYRQLTTQLQDGQLAAGIGFGYTLQEAVNSRFPRLPYPWTRIDYILGNNRLEFLSHRTEPRHAGQHRAVVARLRRPRAL